MEEESKDLVSAATSTLIKTGEEKNNALDEVNVGKKISDDVLKHIDDIRQKRKKIDEMKYKIDRKKRKINYDDEVPKITRKIVGKETAEKLRKKRDRREVHKKKKARAEAWLKYDYENLGKNLDDKDENYDDPFMEENDVAPFEIQQQLPSSDDCLK